MTPAELTPNSYGPTLSPEVLKQLNTYEAALDGQISVEEEAARAKTAQMMTLPESAFTANVVVLCSVWPERLESQPFAHNGMGRMIYHIPAAKIDPVTRHITPAYKAIQNAWAFVMARGGGGVGQEERPDWHPTPISAASIATSIVQKIAGDFAGNARGQLGIGVVKGEIVDGVFRAAKEELDHLISEQTSMLKYLVERADAMWDAGQRERIGRSNRKALEILSLDEGQHPWYRSRTVTLATCPMCAEPVKAESMGCKHCSTNFLDWFTKYPDEYKTGVFVRVDAALRKRKPEPAPMVPPTIVPPVQTQGGGKR